MNKIMLMLIQCFDVCTIQKNQLEPSNYFSSLDGYRLEESHEVGSQQYKIVCSFNLVRCLLDGRPTNILNIDLIILKQLFNN